jgi:quinate/shikimate dehydrogenase (NAD+)
LDGTKRRAWALGLIGSGIGNSLSPALHEREASRLGLEYAYRLFDLDKLGRAPEEVGALVREARALGLDGVNVTHPCKQLVVPELDELSPEAAALNAVNTIVFDGDRLVGHNTDTTGFQEAFARGLPGASTDRVVLLGAGGAGAAVGHAALGLGARHLTVVDLDRNRAEDLVGALERRFGAGRATVGDSSELGDLLAGADGVIHATPTGMAAYPGTVVPAELLHRRLWVAEVVYMPVETVLLASARAMGCRTLSGAAMVALQAAGAMELFTGVRPDRDRMLLHVGELIADRRQAA